jgi:plastocyanin
MGGTAAALIALLGLAAAARADGGPLRDPMSPAWPAGTSFETVVVATDPGAELAYRPPTISVPAAGPLRVVFENVSTEPHNLVFGDGLAGASRSIVEPGTSATVDIVIATQGRYRFSCSVHEGMVGSLVVGG